MFLATLLIATIYLCMYFPFVELSPTIPTAGGGYGFARSAFGPWGGFFTDTAILIEYAIAPATIACFIDACYESLFGVGGWLIYLVFYIMFIGIHILGASKALELVFIITAVAAITSGVFIVAMLPHFDSADLFNIPQTVATGANSFLPFDYIGVWTAIPYAIQSFLTVEDVSLVAEEAKNPRRDLSYRLIGAVLVLFTFTALILVAGPGAAGAKGLMGLGSPLVGALESAYKGSTWMDRFVNLVGLAELITSPSSIIYAHSRQIFALSRAGYLPRGLSLINRKKAPVLALVMPRVIGFGLSLTDQGDLLTLIAAFGATISYMLMMVAHITLRIRRPSMQHPYRTPGGILTSGVALALTCVTVVAGLLADPRVVVDAMTICTALIGYFALYSRHHLVSGTLEEEFTAIQAAEQDPR